MTLHELAERCRDLAMRGRDALYDREPNRPDPYESRAGRERRQGRRAVTMYRPVKAEDWPKTAEEAAARRFNPKTDVQISYKRKRPPLRWDEGRTPTRKSRVRHVETMMNSGEPSVAASVGLGKLWKRLGKHADKRKLHLTTEASAFGSQRVPTEKLAQSYASAGFKNRAALLQERAAKKARKVYRGAELKKALKTIAQKYAEMIPMHRRPRR